MKTLITGTSSGIGKATAELFLERGFLVVGLDRLEATVIHKNYTHFTLDLYKEKDNFPQIEGVNILVNCAGGQNEPDDIDNNLKSAIYVTEKYVLQSTLASVLFVASASAASGSEFPLYAASKGGMVSYMKNVALRLAPRCITVNSLSPGGVITNSNAHILNNKKLYDACKAQTLLGKWATPKECAEFIYFMTVINKSMTAQDIIVDNGEINRQTFIW